MKKRNNLRLLVTAGLLLSLAACTQVPKQENRLADQEAGLQEVKQVLAEQASCWSQGDLECYMQGYWHSDSLVFIGKSGLTYGWQQTLDNYKRSYPTTDAMGKLKFDILETKPLAPETMLVIGKWTLLREAAGNIDGHFSVIFKHFPEGWKIIADHSS
ncbi:DUF4440 domain-containing protein [Pontibacter sp. SGAir0037]|uniref:YybH family protein n=1 Tax=Pontibacter sp. SGAir0037 TaxID=2571030 RepID=UPI0010CCEF98|nr:nuclear transport factor 2 family protein [Pontibacter sp. SGAir0037]QCR21678.1 DUF4440 domain-containing protein [Pontibacter sp. SGAir0037]